MSEHTPTPWAIRPNEFDDWGWIRGADGVLACIARDHDNKSADEHRVDKTDPYAANAALIVEAVNNHESLKSDNARLRSELDQARGMVEEARNGFLAIQKATIEGRVCDDVAWFSDIETLHDYCGHIADRLAVASTERRDG